PGEEPADRPEVAVEVALERAVQVARVERPVVREALLSRELDAAEVALPGGEGLPVVARKLEVRRTRNHRARPRVEEGVVVADVDRDAGVLEHAAKRAVDPLDAHAPGRPELQLDAGQDLLRVG